MASTKWILKWLSIGAISFWVPDILFHFFSQNPPIYFLTFFDPVVVWLTHRFTIEPEPLRSRWGGEALLMVVGIWGFGPLAMAIGAQAQGGSFLDTENLAMFFKMWLMFPVTNIVMSTYSGSLGGLFLVTVGLLASVIGKFGRQVWRQGKSRKELLQN